MLVAEDEGGEPLYALPPACRWQPPHSLLPLFEPPAKQGPLTANHHVPPQEPNCLCLRLPALDPDPEMQEDGGW